jgi:hypothetical protein
MPTPPLHEPPPGTRHLQDWGLADSLLQSALAAFTRAVEMAGTDTRALGNLGNALLAQVGCAHASGRLDACQATVCRLHMGSTHTWLGATTQCVHVQLGSSWLLLWMLACITLCQWRMAAWTVPTHRCPPPSLCLLQGELKQAYLESLLSGPPPTSTQEMNIQR